MRLFIALCILMTLVFCSKRTLTFSIAPAARDIPVDIQSQGQNRHGNNADRFGFFSSALWNDYSGNLFDQIGVFSAMPQYVLWYVQINEAFPVETVEFNTHLGIHTVVSHDLKSTQFTDKQNSQIVSEIIAGKWDKYFKNFARKAKKIDGPVYYRFGYEMNGNWFPWCEQPQLFTEAWRHVWSLFRAEKASNIVWVFCPSILWNPGSVLHDIEPYYPGSRFVDIVAVDGYNFGDFHDKFHKWRMAAEIFSKSLAVLETYNKPIWIAETACPSDPRRVAWLNDFFAFIDSYKKIDVFIWFNEKKASEPDFRIQSDSASLLTFREWLQRKNYEQQEPGLLVENNPPFHNGILE
ncbi:MAG: hypothetical protein JW795_00290 [Chitinivibrionales bacterium]|nr:hypothetical protein [Chitinivibrionales bacterium]